MTTTIHNPRFTIKHSHPKGFSLIELIVVIALVGIMAAIATPGLLSQIPGMRVRTASSQMTSKMLLMRMRAVSENKNYQIVFTPLGNTYQVKILGGAVVETAILPKGIIFASNANKRPNIITTDSCVDTLGVCFTNNAVTFTPTGTAKEGTAGTATMTDGASIFLIPSEDKGTARIDRMRAITVDGVGRVKTWKYTGSAWTNL